jgi:hypothetical protein
MFLFFSREHIVNESMGEMKRKLRFEYSLEKKVRSKLSINCIENLSNELFMKYSIISMLGIYT